MQRLRSCLPGRPRVGSRCTAAFYMPGHRANCPGNLFIPSQREDRSAGEPRAHARQPHEHPRVATSTLRRSGLRRSSGRRTKHSENAKLCELDVCRCRRSVLAHCAYDIPILCHYDNIVEARSGHLADFSFVQLSHGRRSALSILPYVGRMWYHRVAVEHMLHHGIATWADIKWSLNATGRLPPSTLEGPLDAIERAWGSDRHLAKLSVNSMIGLWAAT